MPISDVKPHFKPLTKWYAPAKASLLRRLLYFFARRSYGVLLQKNYRIQHINADFLRKLQAPYIILANHVSNEDPFIYNILCPYPISWIIGKSIERDSKHPWLLRTIRCISRNKEMSDLDTIKKICHWVDDGEVIGIFPEGQTSFSGVSHPLPEATAKLLRFLKIPIVALRNEGGYFANPRWAQQRRCSKKGEGHAITLHYQLLFNQEQIKTAKLTEINNKLQQALYYDPYQKHETTTITKENPSPRPTLDKGLKLQNLAENIELLFYSCLSCQSLESLNSMQSNGMELHCQSCGMAWQISDDSHFIQCGATRYNLEQYYQGQLQLLRNLAADNTLKIQQTFARLRCYTTEEEILHVRKAKHIYYNGFLQLNKQGLELFQNDRQPISKLPNGLSLSSFTLKQIFASHVFKYNTWEFRTRSSAKNSKSLLFVMEFPNKNDSAFLFVDSLKILQEK